MATYTLFITDDNNHRFRWFFVELMVTILSPIFLPMPLKQALSVALLYSILTGIRPTAVADEADAVSFSLPHMWVNARVLLVEV